MSNNCGLIFDDQICNSVAQGQGGACEDPANAICIYGSPQFIPNTAPCALTNESDGPHATRCNGVTGSPAQIGESGPYFCMSLTGAKTWADLSTDSFNAGQGARRWTLREKNHVFGISPCAPLDYCDTGNFWLKWLTRMFVRDSSGWRMSCNEVIQCSEHPNCDQTVDREMTVTLNGPIGITLFEFKMSVAPSCFSQTDMWCFTRDCPDDEVDCLNVGGGLGGVLDAINEPLFVSSARLSTENGEGEAFPYTARQAFRTQLINAAWDEMDDFSDRLDQPGHSSSNRHDSPGLSTWVHDEDMLDTVVQGNATHYAAYDGVDIPLKAFDIVSRLEIDAVLTLKQFNALVYIYVEENNGFQRVTASGILTLGVRVKLTGSAPAGLTLLNVGDPFDLRLQADGSPGVEHASRKLMVVGPNRERVPHQPTDAPTTPHTLRWECLKTGQDMSMGPNLYVANSCGSGCCGTYKAIQSQSFPGRTNDNTQLVEGVFTPKPQRFEGFINVAMRDFGVHCGC